MSLTDKVRNAHLDVIHSARSFSIFPFYLAADLSKDLPEPLQVAAVILGIILSIPTLALSFAVQLVAVVSGLLFGCIVAPLIDGGVELYNNYTCF